MIPFSDRAIIADHRAISPSDMCSSAHSNTFLTSYKSNTGGDGFAGIGQNDLAARNTRLHQRIDERLVVIVVLDNHISVEKVNHEDMPSKGSGKIFGILTMPNGQRIRTMREDAFRAALAAIRPVRTGTRR